MRMRQLSSARRSRGMKAAKSSWVAPARLEKGPPAWINGGSNVKAASSRSMASAAPASTAPGSGSSGGPGTKRPVTARRVSSSWAVRAKGVTAENAKPGTKDWRITTPGSGGDIEGYADRVSAVIGDTVGFYVSTTASSFRIEAYRIGYYQGLGGRLVWRSPSLPGMKQAKSTRDSQTNMVEARWN